MFRPFSGPNIENEKGGAKVSARARGTERRNEAADGR